MNRFRTSHYPIVRIKNRMYCYVEEQGVIIGNYPDLSSLGFENMGNYFKRSVDEQEIESAYRVYENYSVYKGTQVRVGNYKKETGEIFIMFDEEAAGEAAGIKPRIDYDDKCYHYYEAYVPESELMDIYEVRKPVKGFPFKSPEIIYHKKNGEWLPWHDLGTPLKEGEWI